MPAVFSPNFEWLRHSKGQGSIYYGPLYYYSYLLVKGSCLIFFNHCHFSNELPDGADGVQKEEWEPTSDKTSHYQTEN